VRSITHKELAVTNAATGAASAAVAARSTERAFAALRILFGLVFLTNGLAKLWNSSVFAVGPFQFTLVSRDGARGLLTGAVDGTWIAPLGALYQGLVLDNWGFFQWFLTAAELAIGLGLLLGVTSRLAALGGLLLIGPIWLMLLNEPLFLWEYPVELVPLLLLAIVPSGRTAGLDGRLAARFGDRWPF
jgi:uncharacterized membrane protein YphA (DoxX/SURF4 family)